MNLYDNIPHNLFSVLASKNKGIYSKALFIVLEAFKRHLKIRKDELVSMICADLEDDITDSVFDDEELYENEHGFSGKAHFIVRKLKETGWIIVESEDDFIEYVTVPAFSYKIIQTLYEISNVSETENFAYVYTTYSSLKTANESGNAYEKITALNDSYERTHNLIESLTAVFHNIKYYNQLLIDKININEVLADHYDRYQEEIVAKILKPLKIRDSVPKYKMLIVPILKRWFAYDDVKEMVDYLMKNNDARSAEEIKGDIMEKIHYIIDVYESIESNYISPIDSRNHKYTRSTTQKIDYLLNSDRTFSGKLVKLLNALSDTHSAKNEIESSELFELYELEYLNEDSLYQRKKGKPREKRSELIMSDNTEEFIKNAENAARKLLNTKYSREQVQNFIMKQLSSCDTISVAQMEITDDESYIMTLLSVVNAKAKNCGYDAIFNEECITKGKYTIPNITYRRKQK